MSQKQTVTINGREYDARTGLPATADHTSRSALRTQTTTAAQPQQPSAPAARATTKAQQIHQKTQKSKTLNRKFTKKPTPQKIEHTLEKRRAPRIDGVKHSAGTVHASPTLPTAKKSLDLKPVASKPVVAHTPAQHTADIHRPHPVATRAHQVQAAKKASPQTAVPTASVIKQAAIKEAMDTAPKHHAKQHKHSSHKQRLAGIVFGCFALVLFGGYLTYLNVPNLSVRVAAAQAGIDASYPGYQPDGYRLNGPVAYSDGQVQMQFAANTGSTAFTLKQSKSSWDSSALLENYVKEKSNDAYSTSQEKGITIYNYGSNAAWVSGGILYTLDGDAPLSPDQIRKIATSV